MEGGLATENKTMEESEKKEEEVHDHQPESESSPFVCCQGQVELFIRAIFRCFGFGTDHPAADSRSEPEPKAISDTPPDPAPQAVVSRVRPRPRLPPVDPGPGGRTN